MKNPLTPAGIEPATFQIVAQHLNHCATAVIRGRYFSLFHDIAIRSGDPVQEGTTVFFFFFLFFGRGGGRGKVAGAQS